MNRKEKQKELQKLKKELSNYTASKCKPNTKIKRDRLKRQIKELKRTVTDEDFKDPIKKI